ncbi:MAG: hypothetical protein AAF449_19810 [Myxococcota bacterium]
MPSALPGRWPIILRWRALRCLHHCLIPRATKILVHQGDDIRLTDFALTDLLVPSTGEPLPTPNSNKECPPELMNGGNADSRTDVFGLATAILDAIRKVPDEELGVGPQLRRELARAVNADPAQRHQTVADLRSALRA